MFIARQAGADFMMWRGLIEPAAEQRLLIGPPGGKAKRSRRSGAMLEIRISPPTKSLTDYLTDSLPY